MIRWISAYVVETTRIFFFIKSSLPLDENDPIRTGPFLGTLDKQRHLVDLLRKFSKPVVV